MSQATGLRAAPRVHAAGSGAIRKLFFRGKTATPRRVKKRHARVKKAIFRLETRFFSSSIRSARGNADSLW
jgi:hypothetical protein